MITTITIVIVSSSTEETYNPPNRYCNGYFEDTFLYKVPCVSSLCSDPATLEIAEIA